MFPSIGQVHVLLWTQSVDSPYRWRFVKPHLERAPTFGGFLHIIRGGCFTFGGFLHIIHGGCFTFGGM